jgi:TonB-linked SusC/RagA family outer membrane protein
MKRLFTLFTFLLLVLSIYGQGRNITGRVIDASSGDALPGVSVILKGTSVGVVTNLDGEYSIEVAEGAELIFSYIGFIDENIVLSGQSVVDVSLDVDVLSVEEIVVVGYTTQKKSMVTGAISKVSSDDLGKNVSRVEQALQGKTAGVNIMQESGAPGAGITVRIRGVSSNRNSDPLYIVDGMRTGNIDYLNPNDIESIEVLKDAASAAIYGAEGANGVILVSTKSGVGNRESVINYNFNYGMQQVGKINEVLNAKQYATYYREGLRQEIINKYEGIDIPEALLNRKLDEYMPYNPDTLGVGTNWVDEIFTTAPIVEHNLSIAGGTDKTSVFASGSFFNQDGIVGGSKANFKRYTARLRINHEAKDWLDLGTNISYTHIDKKGIEENNEFGGVISNAYAIDPITPIYYSDSTEFPDKYKSQIYAQFDDVYNSSLRAPGDLGYYGMSESVQNEIINPRAQIDNKHEKYATDKLLAGFNLGLKPIDGLVIKTDFNIDLAYEIRKSWSPAYYYHY